MRRGGRVETVMTARTLRGVGLILAWCVAGCGGGGGGGATQDDSDTGPPLIQAAVASFPVENIPPPVLVGGTALVVVSALGAVTRKPLRDAVVVANGVPMAYVDALGAYRGWLEVSTGDTVSLSITHRGVEYRVDGAVAPVYPEILSPGPRNYVSADGATFPDVVRSRPVYVAWSGDLPNPEYQYALAVLDEQGELAWPSRSAFLAVDDP